MFRAPVVALLSTNISLLNACHLKIATPTLGVKRNRAQFSGEFVTCERFLCRICPKYLL